MSGARAVLQHTCSFYALPRPFGSATLRLIFRSRHKSCFHRILMNVINSRRKMLFIPDIPIPILPHPDHLELPAILGSPSTSSALPLFFSIQAELALGVPRFGLVFFRCHNLIVPTTVHFTNSPSVNQYEAKVIRDWDSNRVTRSRPRIRSSCARAI